ncbi:MAG: flagellar motor switch protein FliG [bacterium]
MIMAVTGLSGPQKAAVLMIALGSNVSSEVFKYLRDDEIENLTLEIANLPKVTPEQREQVMNEFHEIMMAQRFILQGGVEYAKDLLKRSLGEERANLLIDKLLSQKKPFEFMRKVDPVQLLNTIQGEHPQTIALVLAYIPPERASVILSELPPAVQSDVVRRLATMERGSPEALQRVETILHTKLASFATTGKRGEARVGGIDSVVDMLNQVERETERTVLEGVGEQDPELAEEIRKRMFTFEDITRLDDRSAQRVLREVDIRELAMALKGASDTAKDMVFRNMPKRAAAMLKEEIEFLGPVRARDVEEAQQKVINVIRQLEDSGEIIVSRGGKGGEKIIT